MKITLNLAEATIIVQTHFANLGIHIRIENIVIEHTNLAEICLNAVKDLAYNDHEKIAAIKSLRIALNKAGIVLGLPDAKFAIENWDKWHEFVRSNGRLPKEGYLYSGILE